MISLAAGAAVVIVMIGTGLFVSRGERIQLTGAIQKVRAHPIDTSRMAVVLDLRLANPGDYPFQVKSVELRIEFDGKVEEGRMVVEQDTAVLFQSVPELGEKYNTSIRTRERFRPKETADRMAAFTVPMSQEQFDRRSSFTLTLRDTDGPFSEFVEARR